MPDLITLSELRDALGIDPTDTRSDGMYTAMIPGVSQAIINYTERDFGSPRVSETRIYSYDGSGYLDIDDADAITEVKFVVPNSTDMLIPSDAWFAAPTRRDDSPVYTYLIFGTSGAYMGSPEMGFIRNLDMWLSDRGGTVAMPSIVKVTGDWGWPEVPADVKQAVVWTIQEWVQSSKNSEQLTQESIESYSRSYGGRGGQASPALAIPNRARDILSNYQRLET